MRLKTGPIETERLRMREITEEDTSLIVEWRSIVEFYQYFNSLKPVTEDEHRKWYLENYINDDDRIDFMVEEKSSGKKIGIFNIKHNTNSPQCVEIGYLLDRNAWGQGYASETVKRLMVLAVDKWECNEAVLSIHEANVKSQDLAFRLGFKEKFREGKFIFYYKVLDKM